MFNFHQKQNQKNQNTTTLELNLGGLHCTSCATNIDLELEDLPGVIESNTNYQTQKSVLKIQPDNVKLDQIKSIIKKLGYQVKD